MERDLGGGIGMGNTCKPMAVSFQCMTKFTTNKLINYLKKKLTIENVNITAVGKISSILLNNVRG